MFGELFFAGASESRDSLVRLAASAPACSHALPWYVHACILPVCVRPEVLRYAGANIGLFALRLLLDRQLALLVAHIYAFEPLPATADVLEANLREHEVEGKVGEET